MFKMTGRLDEDLKDVTLLGNQNTKYLFEYSPEILEVFDNNHPNRDYFVKFNCPEFYKFMSENRTTRFCNNLY